MHVYEGNLGNLGVMFVPTLTGSWPLSKIYLTQGFSPVEAIIHT